MESVSRLLLSYKKLNFFISKIDLKSSSTALLKKHSKMESIESSEKTCIICYTTSVDTPIDCCKKPICSQCWTNSTRNNNRCPHCRTNAITPAVADNDIFKGNGISNHSVIIGNPFDETIANILIWTIYNQTPAIEYAQSKIESNNNNGNIHIRIIEDPTNHKVIGDRDRETQNIIYYHYR